MVPLQGKIIQVQVADIAHTVKRDGAQSLVAQDMVTGSETASRRFNLS
jgi:hypothetical protein